MRSDPADYELIAPGNLQAVVSLLADEPGKWLPIAGGTDVMVLYAAGKLPARKLVSIWNLPELRGIEISPEEIRIGGTLGGNIVNASPAADSLPALLVYEAELILASRRGERRVPYLDFHTGYKKMKLAPDELIRAICLGRRFSNYLHYARKVGAREAQALSKVCVAALGRLRGGVTGSVIDDIRIALGSVAPVPLRLTEVERIAKGKPVEPELVQLMRKMTSAAIRPIDDIRSTARYRSAVAGNMVAEFLQQLRGSGKTV